MASRKLVDGEFLSKLLSGSFEATMGQVDEAVAAQSELFGGIDGDFRTIGTFPGHVIVVNDSGEFFRAGFAYNEQSAEIELGKVERIDVPVREASELSSEARVESRLAVEAILDGDDRKAGSHLGLLYEMVRAGVRLTAEGVEDSMLVGWNLFHDPEWFTAVCENEQGMIKFLGADANQDLPRPKFVDFIESDDTGDERHRKMIKTSLKRLHESLAGMQNMVAFARRVDGRYRLPPISEDLSSEMVSDDFIDFVFEFGADLDATVGLVEDAMAVSEDGALKSLARMHDGVATRVRTMGLAAAFSEKFARRFDQP